MRPCMRKYEIQMGSLVFSFDMKLNVIERSNKLQNSVVYLKRKHIFLSRVFSPLGKIHIKISGRTTMSVRG